MSTVGLSLRAPGSDVETASLDPLTRTNEIGTSITQNTGPPSSIGDIDTPSNTSTPPPEPEPNMARKPGSFAVHTALLFDPKQKAWLRNVSIEINPTTGAIARVVTRSSPDLPSPLPPQDIDLRNKVVLPGFVDSHTHIFLHAYAERPATQQMRDQSLVERTVRAANHARAALLAGYTTYRDLGTEALGNADANLRDCINRGLIPGPRLFVATEALASSGSYEIRVENKVGLGLTVPRAADACDGVSGVRAAVRRRVGDGADVIKFYADYRRKVMRWPNDIESGDGPGNRILFPPDNKKARNPAVPLFSQEEMNAIVGEAALAQLPVAAHAGETRAALMASMAGVNTIEHIFEDTGGLLDRLFEEMKERGTVWVPTLATAEIATTDEIYRWCKAAVKKAHDQGVLLAAGGDTGTFNHGLNAREMEIMVESGIPVEDALVAGTIRGWAACGKDQCGFRFGWFEEGNRADIIALDTDPREDARALRRVSFVMKDGRVWKRDGMPVDMISVPQWPAEEEHLSRDGSSSQGWFEVPS